MNDPFNLSEFISLYGFYLLVFAVIPFVEIIVGMLMWKGSGRKATWGAFLLGAGTTALVIFGAFLITNNYYQRDYAIEIIEGLYALGVLLAFSLLLGIVLLTTFIKKSVRWACIGTFLIGAGLGGLPPLGMFLFVIIIGFV